MLQTAGNNLLATMLESDRRALQPFLKEIKLEHHKVLFEASDAIDSVLFPIDAVLSLMVTLQSGEMIEAAMVGRDGVIGASAGLDGKITLSRAIVQIGGYGLSCGVEVLKDSALAKPTLLSLLIRHEQTLYAQAQQTAACNATHPVEARLSRWLLRSRDLAGSDRLNFTQELLGEMIGATRPAVSLAAIACKRPA